jgi:hypothetical protein
MSKLLRLPLTLLAVLAALFFLPGIAWGDPSDCTDPTAAGCTPPAGTDAVQPTVPENPIVAGSQQPAGENPTPPQDEQPTPPGSVARTSGTLAQLDIGDPPAPLDFCTQFPQAPGCSGTNPPTVPLTCDGLAQVLGQTGGCPSSFSCEDLATLLGVTCPAGPPDCHALAELFHLDGCPAPPTNCDAFAAMLHLDNCSQIPCMDTSQLPPQARDGLKPLFDGLEQIGIKQCPVKPVGSTPPPGKGTYMPPPQAAQQPSAPYYANCDDARAHGATNIPQGTPGYRPELDADHDGFACDEHQAVQAAQQPTGRLAYTGMELGPQLNLAWSLLVLGAGLLILGRRRA